MKDAFPRSRSTRRAGSVAVLLAVVAALGRPSAGAASAASRGFKLKNTSNVDLKLEAAKPVPTVNPRLQPLLRPHQLIDGLRGAPGQRLGPQAERHP